MMGIAYYGNMVEEENDVFALKWNFCRPSYSLNYLGFGKFGGFSVEVSSCSG